MTHHEQHCCLAAGGREIHIGGTNVIRPALMLAAGAALGAASMYFFDPHRGKARRIDIWQRKMRALRRGGHYFTKHAEDLLNRARGAIAKVNAALLPFDATGDDTTTEERVRSRLGHVAPHADAIQTDVAGGVVTLRGAVPQQTHRHVVDEVLTVPGVMGVRDHLVAAG